MKGTIIYDEATGSAYIKVKPGSKVHKTVSAADNVNFDYDLKGNLVGVEILSASLVLSKNCGSDGN